MKPEVDWVRFMVLMEGQCEPGMSEYEVSEERVRLATIDPELWMDTADERDSGAEIAKAMSQWRETQQESELRFPCYPSDVKRWAERQFLDVGQELEDACNDEVRERLTMADPRPTQEERETLKTAALQERAILAEIERRGLDPHSLSWYPGQRGDKQHIEAVMLKNRSLFTEKSFEKAWESLSRKGLIRNNRRKPLSP
jgi:hypothetical protein